MKKLVSVQKWCPFGMGRAFVLGTLIILGAVISIVATSSNVSAHLGDTSLVHACVNAANAEVRIVHPRTWRCNHRLSRGSRRVLD